MRPASSSRSRSQTGTTTVAPGKGDANDLPDVSQPEFNDMPERANRLVEQPDRIGAEGFEKDSDDERNNDQSPEHRYRRAADQAGENIVDHRAKTS